MLSNWNRLFQSRLRGHRRSQNPESGWLNASSEILEARILLFAFDPDDQPSEAIPLQDGATIGFISEPTDVDAYGFTATAGDTFSVTVSPSSGSPLVPEITLYGPRSSGSPGPVSLFKSNSTISWSAAHTGNYYIVVANDDQTYVFSTGFDGTPPIGATSGGFNLFASGIGGGGGDDDTTRPVASATSSDILLGIGNAHDLTVTYTDNVAVDVSDIGSSDILVTGPNGFSQTATFIDRTRNTDGTPVSATYRINSPGTRWMSTDNGTYSILMRSAQVSDTSGNFVRSGTIGSFEIAIPLEGASIELADLDGSNGFRLDGSSTSHRSGIAVAGAGDVNGDGFGDILIGAPNANSSFLAPRTGKSYLIFGSANAFSSTVSLSTLNGSNGYVLDGIDNSDEFGASVSMAGDVNGDGFSDILIGAPEADPAGKGNAGESYVIFGGATRDSSTFAAADLDGSNGFRIDGVKSTFTGGLGGTVSTAGDVNGDGLDDIILGLPDGAPDGRTVAGETYVVFGRRNGWTAAFDPTVLDGTNGFRVDGIDVGDVSGTSVSQAGDVNGDGYGDILIGADKADAGRFQAGESYVVFGRPGGFSSSIGLDSLDGTNGFRLDGVGSSDYSGETLSAAGDVNGDGYDDVIIGARGADPNGNSQAGESYVVFGKPGSFASAVDLSTLNGADGFRLDGISASDNSSKSVSSAGDVNGDGFDDILIGAQGADPGGRSGAGQTYLVFGRPGNFPAAIALNSLNGSNGLQINGVDSGDYSGMAVSGAGDVNGDGFDDVLIGAFGADANGRSSSGESYVVFGRNWTGGDETRVGDSGANTLLASRGGQAVDVLIGGAGADLLVSDGGADVLRGGEGDDVLAIPDTDFSGTRRLLGGNGTDVLRLDGSGIQLDLTAISDNRIVDIEEIDITGSGDNTLTLDFLEVVNISSHSNTLFVKRDSGDIVNRGNGWDRQANEVIDGGAFEVFTQGAATLKVQSTNVVEATGDVDGDNDFDANDTFLTNIAFLGATDAQLNQFKGASPLTAGEIRARISQLSGSGLLDVDDDGDTDANDAFLANISKLGASDQQIDDFKGSSSLTAPQIRTRVDALAPAAGVAASAQRPVARFLVPLLTAAPETVTADADGFEDSADDSSKTTDRFDSDAQFTANAFNQLMDELL